MPSSIRNKNPEHSIPPPSAYRRAHGGTDYPAAIIHRYIRDNGMPDTVGITTLAAELRLPESVVISTLSYYSDFSTPSGDDRKICNGFSCFLSSNADDRFPAQQKCVSCLGYCHRENNYLENNSIHTTGDDTPPSILCLAPQAVTTRNLLEDQPVSLNNALKKGCYESFRYALEQPPVNIIADVITSGLRGRGGAAFPTGSKWQSCAATPAEQRYVIANGDEGDPGSYIDRILLENDPHSIIEGMLLCGFAVGASEGIIYIRSEYPQAARIMQRAVTEAKNAGLFKAENFSFNITIIHGAGSYVCGEETALINAIEGLRGEVRLRPPFPTEAGLFGKPTVVNNVETLANIPYIMGNGARIYAGMGTTASPGTKTLCFNHGFHRPGLVEVEFGTPFQTALDATGGGRTPLAAALVGGPMGCVIPPEQWDVPICFEAMRARGFELGHGSVIALSHSADKRALLRHWLKFMEAESCGKCAPCRIGSTQSCQIADPPFTPGSHAELESLLHVINRSSLCAFGREIPRALTQYLTLLKNEILSPASP